MKRTLAFIIIYFIFSIHHIQASHAAGGEISYKCLGNDQYEVTIVFYTNCFNNIPPMVMDLNVSDACLTYSSNVVLNFVPPSIIISPTCPGQVSACNGGTAPGLERYVYKGIVMLIGPCDGWTFSYTVSARTIFVTSINNNSYYNLYVEASLNKAGGICNSSPTFNDDPTIYTCVGQPVCIDPGVVEPDGDSLAFELIAPLSDPNSTLSYVPGYSYLQPLISNPLVRIDHTNGKIYVTPTDQQAGILCILIKEYRNGILIGQVERDISFYVVRCPNNAPTLSGINGSSIYNLSVCAGEPACFTINSIDSDLTDSTTIDWDHSIPSASMTHYGGLKDSAFFCWITSKSDVNSTPHNFIVSVNDNNCNYPAAQNYIFSITVHDTDSTCLYLSANNILSTENLFIIYPQPATGNFFVDLGSELYKQKELHLRIYNIYGENISNQPINERIVSVDIRQIFYDGIYIASVEDKDGVVLQRRKISIAKR